MTDSVTTYPLTLESFLDSYQGNCGPIFPRNHPDSICNAILVVKNGEVLHLLAPVGENSEQLVDFLNRNGFCDLKETTEYEQTVYEQTVYSNLSGTFAAIVGYR